MNKPEAEIKNDANIPKNESVSHQPTCQSTLAQLKCMLFWFGEHQPVLFLAYLI